MLNINELEHRWLRYKIKSYIPHTIISISIIFIAAITLTFFTEKEMKPLKNELIKKTSTPLTQTIIKETPTINNDIQINPSPTSGSGSKMIITPSLDFMKKMQRDTLSNYENHAASYSKKQTTQAPVQVTKKHKKTNQKKLIEVNTAPPEIKEKKNSISIKRQNTHDDISQVISRFNKNNNPALSLFIAKKYYELGNYHKSYNYALITNEINNEIEASWIVFTKSLVKLNKKDLAIKTLKKYISQSNSNRANMLLDDITSGKFK